VGSRTDNHPDVSRQEPDLCRISYRDSLGDESTIVVGVRPVCIGRAQHCDLILGHESVSREHAKILRTNAGWVISDLGSKNGLKINTYRTRQQQLRDGDCIDIGTAKLWVEIGPLSPTGKARVVFQQESAGHRAEVLDMDRFDSLFASSPGLGIPLSPEASRSDGPALKPREQSASLGAPVSLEEPVGLLGVFSQAAEALLTCDGLDQTLERILKLVFDNVTADRGVICLYDEETDTMEPKVMRTRQGVPDEPIVISTNIANDCIKNRQSLLVKDANVDARFGGADSIIAMCIHSAMCAPLYRDGRVAGFIYIDQQSELHAFTARQLQTLSTLAILSAVAVEQAALREDVRREQEMRSRLARYSSPAVVERIIHDPDVAERGMSAEEGDITVLFADITSFTSLAERLAPREVVEVLNQIFERLTEEVFALEGTLDKFRGDGMMAFFGAPLAMPDHAARAVECALRMQARLAELNAESTSTRDFAMRIGINSGPVVVGDIGSPQRKDYTVIGDVVNTASRLESSIAEPGQVVIGHATYERVRARFECEALPEVFVKGKRHRVRPYLAVGRIR
jgi:adenylate cyclase